MLFHSFDFLIFYTVVVVLYFALSRGCSSSAVARYRWLLLLAASYTFYAAGAPEYLVWIVASTLIDYVAGIQIAKTTDRSVRRGLLVFSIVSNLGLLVAAKYLGFANESIRAVLGQFNVLYAGPAFEILLPVGISFFTLQTIGYTIDVYRGKIEPERHLGFFALFVSFFPQLVAGPIERAGKLLPQFRAPREFSASRVASGLRLALWGMFKKVVIADRLIVYVNGVYDHPADYQGLPILMATLFFAIQIYCDFSGYSDIALGIAQVMGYDLTQNFRQPYFATSIVEFWRRWHISLSGWFRDYLYIPLGGNRVPRWRWYANLMVVFVASGLWHGANWTFVLWGGLHGLYYLLEVWTQGVWDAGAQLLHLDAKPAFRAFIGGLLTFVGVCLAWVFFRANSISDAFLLIGGMLGPGSASGPGLSTEPIANAASGSLGRSAILAPWGSAVGAPGLELALSCVLIALLVFVDWIHASGVQTDVDHPRLVWIRSLDLKRNVWIRWAVYLILALAIMNLGVRQGTPFVYMQF